MHLNRNWSLVIFPPLYPWQYFSTVIMNKSRFVECRWLSFLWVMGWSWTRDRQQFAGGWIGDETRQQILHSIWQFKIRGKKGIFLLVLNCFQCLSCLLVKSRSVWSFQTLLIGLETIDTFWNNHLLLVLLTLFQSGDYKIDTCLLFSLHLFSLWIRATKPE